MNTVEPIRDLDTLLDMCNYLYEENKRNWFLFMLGINTARRISDMLPLRVRDVRHKNYLVVREKKTNKRIEVPLNSDIKKAIREYCEGKGEFDYLFPSRNGGYLKRGQAYRIMKELGDVFEVPCLGTHTMRKTFGYWYIKKGGSIEVLMEILNHSDPAVTRRYIGITSQTALNAVKNFSFFGAK